MPIIPRIITRSFMMASNSLQKPLITVIGATGTGKSQLAVELASRFNGEIINGDAMQLYDGLPIITNKIPEAERKGIPHHLLGCVNLSEETWTVDRFVEKARSLIEDIYQRGRLPILVGGTHYYTQALLFPETSLSVVGNLHKVTTDLEEAGSQKWPILEEPTDVILAKLREIDPIMAARWHPNDRRKIQRSLEIYLTTGRPASEIYEEQFTRKNSVSSTNASHEAAGETIVSQSTHPKMNFQALVLWVYCSPEELRQRLDNRVEKMIEEGLLSEVSSLESFRAAQEARGNPVDQTRGIWQSIGYRQFQPYHEAKQLGSLPVTQLEKMKIDATEEVKAANRQYAKRQIRWIRIKLLNALNDAGSAQNTFLLDGSDLAKWNEEVLKPGLEISELFLNASVLPAPESISSAAADLLKPKREYDMSQRRDLWHQRTCEICKTVAVTEDQWQLHLNSQRHRRTLKAREKRSHMLVSLDLDQQSNDTEGLT